MVSSRLRGAAYAWRHFLNNTNLLPEVAIWLPRLPMTKAVVKAMDAVQAFIATLKNPSIPAVNNFVVAGASKRGWYAPGQHQPTRHLLFSSRVRTGPLGLLPLSTSVSWVSSRW